MAKNYCWPLKKQNDGRNQINYSDLLSFDKKEAYFSKNFNIITILRGKHCD